MDMIFPRRQFLIASSLLLGSYTQMEWLPWSRAEIPMDDPLQNYRLEWTQSIPWKNTIDISTVPLERMEEKVDFAQKKLVSMGGGVIYFPAGTYQFKDSIRLLDGIILRGEAPKMITEAKSEKYQLATRFEFPKYEPIFEGDGSDINQAFKGIYLQNPATASNVGILHIEINRGHIHFKDDGSEKHLAGKNRFVVGCILKNAAVADPTIPSLKSGQKAWQRFTARHHAAIDICSGENLLVANNRLPKSGDDNFTMNGFILQGRDKKPTSIDGLIFDYDNRPGLYVNHYSIGGSGGNGPDGTPETHPHGFRKGIIIRDNYIFNTGRMGIGFCGDGVKCLNNLIRIPEGIWRPTATGTVLTFGSSTNDNRAIEMRGWRWVVDGNDYIVHRNWAFDKKYLINDGEGLMHEDHVNSTIKDSVLTNNRGNTYLSLYKTAGIDGLLVEGNEIKLNDGKQTIAKGAAIFVSADRTKSRFFCKNVKIINNKLSGGGILISGDPSENNLIKGNQYLGEGKAIITVQANATVENNQGFEIKQG